MAKIEVYTPVEGVEMVTLHHPELDKERGEVNTIDVAPEQVEIYEQSGWKKAPAKVAKAAEKEDES